MLKRLILISVLLLSIFSSYGVSDTKVDLSVLPTGGIKQALDIPHFPNKVDAFVWRNWNLVDIDRMALVLKTKPENIAERARLMGLPPYKKPTWTIAQIYITLVRRNWHILPYEQILTLLDMTPEKLAFNLKEDDFLWVKLGGLKPNCSPIVYQPLTEEEKTELRKIATIVREEFGDSFTDKDEDPRFSFVKELSSVDKNFQPPKKTKSRFELRYVYSYFGLFGDPLLDDKAEVYPEGLLQKLSSHGVNGVWLHVVLRDLAPGGYFKEFGKDHEKRIANLRRLVATAKKYNIGIYLYMNEPRAMAIDFFKKYPEVAGAIKPNVNLQAMCISHPEVRKWLGDSLAYIFKEIPDLGGIFTITASENYTNCASHGEGFLKTCPRCSKKGYANVIAETNAILEEGVHRSAPNAKVLVWDWGWFGNQLGKGPEIITKLPKNVWVMSVSEWALPINRGGVHTIISEYSISGVGPGPRAQEEWKSALENGLKSAAKVQLNTTWEIGSIPYIPATDLVARHCRQLATSGVTAMMMSWSLGGHPSLNLKIPQIFDRDPLPTLEEALNELALDLYGSEGAPLARQGWTKISNAFEEFPYGNVYSPPYQVGPANFLYLKPTEYAATMVGIPYDALSQWRGIYPEDVYENQFVKMFKGFMEGSALLEQAAKKAPIDHRKEADEQTRFGKTAGIIYGSTANQVKFIRLRNKLIDPKTSASEKKLVAADMIKVVRQEIDMARQLYRITKEDSRIGFESTNHYWFVPNDLVEKVISCRQIIEELSK